jgi:hypothetical protein
MDALTVEQLRAAHSAGGVAAVALEAQGAAFVVAATFRSGGRAVLVLTRNKQPRRFADPRQAFRVLRELGFAVVACDLTKWTPEQRELNAGRPDRSAALKKAHALLAQEGQP